MKKILIENTDILYENFESFMDGTQKGVIELPVPVADITKWYKNPLTLTTFTGLSKEDIERVLYYTGWLVTGSGDKGPAEGTVLTEKEFLDAKERCGSGFGAMQGPGALTAAMEKFDIGSFAKGLREKEVSAMAEMETLRGEDGVAEKDERRYMELTGELSRIRALIDAETNALVIGKALSVTAIPLFPLCLRPVVKDMSDLLPYGVYHDLEELYGSVVSRAGRLKRLMELDAPDVVMCDEKRLLQEAVDTLFANGMRGEPKTKRGSDIPLCSLADILLCHARFS